MMLDEGFGNPKERPTKAEDAKSEGLGLLNHTRDDAMNKGGARPPVKQWTV